MSDYRFLRSGPFVVAQMSSVAQTPHQASDASTREGDEGQSSALQINDAIARNFAAFNQNQGLARQEPDDPDVAEKVLWENAASRLIKTTPTSDLQKWADVYERHLPVSQTPSRRATMQRRGESIEMWESRSRLEAVIGSLTSAKDFRSTLARKGTAVETAILDSFEPFSYMLWAFVYITLKSLESTRLNRKRRFFEMVVSTVGQTRGFIDLAKLVSQEITEDEKDTTPVSLSDETRQPNRSPTGVLVDLYALLLRFHIKATAVLSGIEADPDLLFTDMSNSIESSVKQFLTSLDGNKFRLAVDSVVSAKDPIITAYESFTNINNEKLAALDSNNDVDAPCLVFGVDGARVLFECASRDELLMTFCHWDVQEDSHERPDSSNDSEDMGKRILWILGSPETNKAALLSTIVTNLREDGHATAFFFRREQRWPWDLKGQLLDQNLIDDSLEAVKSLVHGVLLCQPHLMKHLESLRIDGFNTRKMAVPQYDFRGHGGFSALSMLLCRLVQDETFEETYFVLDGIGKHAKRSIFDDQLLSLMAITTALSKRVRWILSIDRGTWLDVQAAMAMLAPAMHDFQIIDIDKYVSDDDYRQLNFFCLSTIIVDLQNDTNFSDQDFGYFDNLFSTNIIDLRLPNLQWLHAAVQDVVQNRPLPWLVEDTLFQLVYSHPTLPELYDKLFSVAAPAFDGNTCYDPNPESATSNCLNVLFVAGSALRPLSIVEMQNIAQLHTTFGLAMLLQRVLRAFLTTVTDVHGVSTVRFVNDTARAYIARRLSDGTVSFFGSSATELGIARTCLALLAEEVHCSCRGIRYMNGWLINYRESEKTNKDLDYTTYMWLAHLARDGVPFDAEIYGLVTHLVTVHLCRWLTLLGSNIGTVFECLFLLQTLLAKLEQLPDTGHSVEPDLISKAISVRKAASILREVIIVVQHYTVWLRKPQQENKTPSTEKTKKAEFQHHLDALILFSPNLTFLRQSLMPRQYFWLAQQPRLFGDNSEWNQPLHSIKHGTAINDCCFSPDGQAVATAAGDGRIRLWDTRTGTLIHSLAAFNNNARGVAMVPWNLPRSVVDGLPARTTVASSSGFFTAAYSPSTIKAWDITTERHQIRTIKTAMRINGIALSPKMDKLAIAGDSGFYVWEALREDLVQDKDVPPRLVVYHPETETRCAAFSSDGELVASVHQSHIKIWKSTQTNIHVITIPNDELLKGEGNKPWNYIRRRHLYRMTCIAFSPNGEFLAVGCEVRFIEVWHIASRRLVAFLDFLDSCISCVAFTPDGSCIAAGDQDGLVLFWKQKKAGTWIQDEADGSDDSQPSLRLEADRFMTFKGRQAGITSIAFAPRLPPSLNFDGLGVSTVSSPSPSSVWLAFTSRAGVLRITDIDLNTIGGQDQDADMKFICDDIERLDFDELPRQRDTIAFTLSPQSDLLATGHGSGRVCLWNTQTGEALQRSKLGETFAAPVYSTKFSPDGELLTTAQGTSGNFVGICFRIFNVSQALLSSETPHREMVPRLIIEEQHDVIHHTYSRDGNFLGVCVSVDDTHGLQLQGGARPVIIRVYDISRARSVEALVSQKPADIDKPDYECITTMVHDMFVCCAFSPDGHHIAAGSIDGVIHVWNLANDGEMHPDGLEPQYTGKDSEEISTILYSDDGTKIITSSKQEHIAIWMWADHTSSQPSTLSRVVVSTRLKMEVQGDMWFNVQKYPGVIFTDKGPLCVDLDNTVPKEDDRSDIKSADLEEAKKYIHNSLRWSLPACAVSDNTVRWNNHTIAIPERLEGTSVEWQVRGKVMAILRPKAVCVIRFKKSLDIRPSGDESRPR